MKVICNNCGIKWNRVTDIDNPGGTVPYTEIQYNCPKCGSNDYKEQEMKVKNEHNK